MIIGKIIEGLSARLAADVEDIGGEDEGGWGDNDLKLDDEDDMGDEFKDAEADSNAKGTAGRRRMISRSPRTWRPLLSRRILARVWMTDTLLPQSAAARPALRQSDYEVTFFLSLSSRDFMGGIYI